MPCLYSLHQFLALIDTSMESLLWFRIYLSWNAGWVLFKTMATAQVNSGYYNNSISQVALNHDRYHGVREKDHTILHLVSQAKALNVHGPFTPLKGDLFISQESAFWILLCLFWLSYYTAYNTFNVPDLLIYVYSSVIGVNETYSHPNNLSALVSNMLSGSFAFLSLYMSLYTCVKCSMWLLSIPNLAVCCLHYCPIG